MTQIFVRLSGSVAVKVSAILLAMGAMTVAAILVGFVVFRSFSGSLDHLHDVLVPNLERSSETIAAAGEVADRLSAILVAGDVEGMAAQQRATDTAIDQLRVPSGGAGSGALAEERIEEVRASIHEVVAARSEELVQDAATVEASNALSEQTAKAGALTLALTDRAFDAVIDGGEETVAVVSSTLEELVGEDFGLLRLALETRAEIYLLTGMTHALSQVTDPAVITMMVDVATSSAVKLGENVEELAQYEMVAPYVEPIRTSQIFFGDLAKGGFTFRRDLTDEIVALRQESDAALASAIDDITFELTMRSEDVAGSNEAAIRGLLDNQVENIRMAGALDLAVNSFFAAALNGAAADEMDGVVAAQAELAAGAREITNLLGRVAVSDELKDLMSDIIAHADPGEGLLASRARVIDARNAAAATSDEAAAAVSRITEDARRLGSEAVADIAAAGLTLRGEASAAERKMSAIALGSVVVLLAAPLLTLLLIVRPLLAVTRVTERLAKGDLAPVDGFHRQGGEIGRMAAALRIFRDGMIERTRLQREEAEREAAERARSAREEREARERAQAERTREEQSERDRLEREGEELRAREETRAAAEAERQKHAAEQSRVVTQLAEGMKHLAAGKLGYRIAEAFPEAYEALRVDFNGAIGTLADLICDISESAGKIDLSSGEISAAAVDMSRRTEHSAATLEETAAALNELTASVTATAEGAGQADRTVQGTKASAEKSSEVVREAVSAMSEIEESSKQIAKIIDVIDDIAFQTNLLALNAGVEAARAGDAGRGFAVVASEVRALAQRSSEAAREINGLISRSNSQVERGVALVDEAGNALQAIIGSIGEISRHVSEIASSAREQATGITEINTAASQLDEATQQNAAMFEESTAASRILTDEARSLAEMIARFSLERDAGAEPSRVDDVRLSA